jgi:hypothetical protein
MNLRSIFGDAAADAVLEMPISHGAILFGGKASRRCCIIGALMAETAIEQDLNVHAVEFWPSRDVAILQTQDLINRPLTTQEMHTIGDAIEAWDDDYRMAINDRMEATRSTLLARPISEEAL